MAKPKLQKQEKVRFCDLPELDETFIDSFRQITFDGATFRIECCVKRMEEPKPPSPPSFKQYPAARLVITPEAAMKLYNQLSQIIGALKQQGLVQNEPITPSTLN